jgi:hypothetical protein
MFTIVLATFLSIQGYHSHFIQIWYMIRVPLGGTLFILTKFHTLHHTITTHPTCVFLSFVNDIYIYIYIVGHVSNVVLVFLCLQAKKFNIRIFYSIDNVCNLVST